MIKFILVFIYINKYIGICFLIICVLLEVLDDFFLYSIMFVGYNFCFISLLNNNSFLLLKFFLGV